MSEKPVCIICLNPCLTPAVLHLDCSCKYNLVHYRCMMRWWRKSPVCIMCHTPCDAPELLSKIANMSAYDRGKRGLGKFIRKKCRGLNQVLERGLIDNRGKIFFIYLAVLTYCWRVFSIGYSTGYSLASSPRATSTNVSIHIDDLRKLI